MRVDGQSISLCCEQLVLILRGSYVAPIKLQLWRWLLQKSDWIITDGEFWPVPEECFRHYAVHAQPSECDIAVTQFAILLAITIIRTPGFERRPTEKNAVKTKTEDGGQIEAARHQNYQLVLIWRLDKIRRSIGLARKVMRLGVILGAFLLFYHELTNLLSHPFSLSQYCYFGQTLADCVFLVLNQITLYHQMMGNQTKFLRADRRETLYGSIPNYLFATCKFGLQIYSQLRIPTLGVDASTILNFTQNALDSILFIMFVVKPAKQKTIGTLGVITSVMAIRKGLL